MAAVCYVDTSALVKRYVEEAGSTAFDDFCEAGRLDLVISPLVATEFAGTLRRRVRLGDLGARYASAARRRFNDDVASGGWRMIAIETAVYSQAAELTWTLGAPLATLDAMHLAAALLNGAEGLATADRQLAEAARRAKLHVHLFQ